MNGDPNAPAEQPRPQVLNNYLVRCLNGWSVNVAVPHDLPTFVKFAAADGGIPSDKMWIVYHNIVSIEYVGPFNPQQNVMTLPFGSQQKP